MLSAHLQDRRAPDPACPVLHPPARREQLDITPVWKDSRTHRPTRAASDLIERTGHAGRETRSGSIPAGVSLAVGWVQAAGSGARGVSGAGSARTPLSSILNGRHVWLEGAPLTRQRKREKEMGTYRNSRPRTLRQAKYEWPTGSIETPLPWGADMPRNLTGTFADV
jgi:hypothetical protein